MPPNELEKHIRDKSESAETIFEKEERNREVLEIYQAACRLLYEKNPNWYYIMIDSCLLDMTSKEIGEILNLSAKHVEVMKTRARAYLRKMLGDQYHEL